MRDRALAKQCKHQHKFMQIAASSVTHHDVVLLGGVCNLHAPGATNRMVRNVPVASDLV
jgi:hypothetical protein